jgi:EAL and modified HD-GYP domain-containing signal transduction protein
MGKDKAENIYLIGRQPILNRNEEVVAYELLFRSVNSREKADVADASYATSNVILHTLSGFGLIQILGRHKGFINVELDLLMSDTIEILPKERIVLELLETLTVSPELVQRCRELKDKGVTLAIDDHQFDVAYADLYEIAEIVKIDLMQSPVDTLAGMVKEFSRYPVKLLAEKVETRKEFLQCLDLGFEYFQGYYFAKPSVLEKRRIDETASTLLKLMRLLSEDTDIEVIELAFRRSPGLTYKLILLVNSVSLGMRESIHSIRHAIAILGYQQLKRWVQLSLFASSDNRTFLNPLMEMATVRARFMEQLALRHPLLKCDDNSPEQAFMVGILSLLEKIYEVSTDDIVSVLNLSDEVKKALLTRKGALGQILEIAELLDQTYCRVTSEQLEELGVTREDVLNAQIDAFQWLGVETF